MKNKMIWSVIIPGIMFTIYFAITCLDYKYDYDVWTYTWLYATILKFTWLLQGVVREVIKYELKKFKED